MHCHCGTITPEQCTAKTPWQCNAPALQYVNGRLPLGCSVGTTANQHPKAPRLWTGLPKQCLGWWFKPGHLQPYTHFQAGPTVLQTLSDCGVHQSYKHFQTGGAHFYNLLPLAGHKACENCMMESMSWAPWVWKLNATNTIPSHGGQEIHFATNTIIAGSNL